MGANRVREARHQKLRREFENVAFKDNESIEDFSLRLAGILTELQSLGDTVTELPDIQKFLHVVPPRYVQMACSIETLLDLSELSIEELSGERACVSPSVVLVINDNPYGLMFTLRYSYRSCP